MIIVNLKVWPAVVKEDGVYVLAKTIVIGRHCEIICERGLAAVPELVAVINQTALANGFLPLHSAVFNCQVVGILTTGWSKSGKTESLLAFMANGAEYEFRLGD